MGTQGDDDTDNTDNTDATNDTDNTDETDDAIRFAMRAYDWLHGQVAHRLAERGWVVSDLRVPDGQPLEWFWPPTAPVGHGGLPDWGLDAMRRRAEMYGPRQTPWSRPTRLTGSADGAAWLLEYGEAAARRPDPPRQYTDERELLADLERIECWPMSVAETRQVRAARIVEVTTAMAHDDHYRAEYPTEPYASRMDALRQPGGRGDPTARRILLDAESWASAVRTARAGGAGWGVGGREH